MNQRVKGVLLGAVTGVIDVAPMIIMGLTWDANLAAFSMWVVAGFFIASIHLAIKPILKGILVSVLVLLPSAFIIGWDDPLSLVPISLMTIILGGLLGYFIHK